jgi:uncharacterized cupin superfamily protein
MTIIGSGAARSRLLAVDARMMELEHLELDPADVIGGSPRTNLSALVSAGDVEIGIWEITSGIVTDIESDEVFVVLGGRGLVEFDEGASLSLSTGSVVRLRAGDRTTWTIYETLRKVYVVLPPDKL